MVITDFFNFRVSCKCDQELFGVFCQVLDREAEEQQDHSGTLRSSALLWGNNLGREERNRDLRGARS